MINVEHITVHNYMINIGQRIKEELDRQERSVTWLAQKLNCTRASVYRILAKNSIDTSLLLSISIILHYDFFRVLSDDVKSRSISQNDTDVYHL